MCGTWNKPPTSKGKNVFLCAHKKMKKRNLPKIIKILHTLDSKVVSISLKVLFIYFIFNNFDLKKPEILIILCSRY